MVCIYCGGETQVINSRHHKKSNQVWRRRRCTICHGVFTSYETADLMSSLLFKKETRHVEPFQRDILFISIHEACKHRINAVTAATALTETVLGRLYRHIHDASIDRSDVVSVTLEVLKRFDKAAAVQYAAYHPL